MVAYIWLNILVGIFVISLFYMIFSQVLYVHIQPLILPQLQNLSAPVNSTQVRATLDLIEFVWQYWPLILIFGLIIYGIVASQKREPDYYYE